MSVVVVVFPWCAGGNHLKNILVSDISKLNYTGSTVHQTPGSNLQASQVETALANPEDTHVLHGHFGEIMSYQNQIRDIKDKKFIVICNDNANDFKLLSDRQKKLGNFSLTHGGYYEGEQVFLYESFMYHHYFDVPMENIMNITITEFFVEDISAVIDRINFFLNSNIDVRAAHNLHTIWYRNNFK